MEKTSLAQWYKKAKKKSEAFRKAIVQPMDADGKPKGRRVVFKDVREFLKHPEVMREFEPCDGGARRLWRRDRQRS